MPDGEPSGKAGSNAWSSLDRLAPHVLLVQHVEDAVGLQDRKHPVVGVDRERRALAHRQQARHGIDLAIGQDHARLSDCGEACRPWDEAAGSRSICWRRSGEALIRNQCSPSALIAIDAWVLWSSGCSLRAARQTGHPQFHCGTPPPAAAPRTTTRSMIRLLEILKARMSKADSKGGRRRHDPRSGRITPGGPPASSMKLPRIAYLRAAHAYMLISMPTGTSTIFGVFQAMLALHLKPDDLPPSG